MTEWLIGLLGLALLAQDVTVLPSSTFRATVSLTMPAEAPFDLTGRWTLVSATLGDGMPRIDGAFGGGFVAAQTAEYLMIDGPSAGTGRGGVPRLPVHVTYRFDGSETNVDVSVNPMSFSRTRMWTTTSWAGNRLRIVRHESINDTRARVMFHVDVWRDDDGTIVAERTDNPSGDYTGGATLAWKARYMQIKEAPGEGHGRSLH